MDFNKVNICDIETPRQAFLLCSYQTENKEYVDFLISDKRNDLYPMIKWLNANKDIPMVGWNSLNFDNQVIEWILRNYEKWYDLSGLEIAKLISREADSVIENSKYGVFQRYRESDMSFKIIDLFKIHHGDNKNRMASMSLKCMEYYLDRNIDVFDWSNDNETFTDEEINKLITYCRDEDVVTTYHMYLLTIGQTDNPVYKDNNQIQIRIDIKEEFGISCMNYSNAKIGDEIIKLFYCNEKKIKYEHLPKSGLFRKQIYLSHAIPDYVKFETEQLQQLLKEIKATTLKQNEEYNKKFTFRGETYKLAKGGLHSESTNKQYHSDDEYVIIDADVSGYYIVTAIEREYYPYHLGREFLIGYTKMYNKRIELKPLSKTDKKIKGIVQGLKEGGVAVFGKSSDIESWLYDKQMTINICISGEVTLLMLIEQQELIGNQCIMANTDGATFIVKRTETDKFYQICKDWEKMTKYQLEYQEFKSLWFSNVNNYLGVKTDGGIKKKGDAFLTDYEVFKDKSNKVIPLSLEAYFIKGIEPEEFINKHDNIFDFCAREKVNRDFYLKSIDKKTGKEEMYNKLIRQYVSNEGVKLYKMKRDSCQTNAAKISEVVADELYQTMLNKPDPTTFKEHLKNVKREWYIQKAKEVIFKIEKGKKPKKTKTNPNQSSLF